MTLASGTRLGPYAVLAPIGQVREQGAASVFTQDGDRLKRFEQEARSAGVLNHPNVTIVTSRQRTYAYSYMWMRSNLHIAEGLI